ncbi:MAG: DNA polymerase III subunit gamma/tau [Acidobacteriota bacterium]|nr:MAG: DNA polymerase III subunit gamma/tau [Acidobacteriota bacterium]
MSYQVIARKWRPHTFEEVTGQDVITRTLRNAIESGRLHHAYLFSGARGVGKTTTARIIAKALNCHRSEGPTLTPCRTDDENACPSCMEISESRSMDVLEIDAASHTGIDDVRDTIIDNINVNPARDRYKVFIIDEVHQLSKPAFNALLKTLEEPPPNVLFVMATTELHKVPITITSRCQEFQFRTIPLQKILDRLTFIAKAEGIKISDEALREIARSGEGSMRDAQSNFDQVISFSSDEITAEDVANALGFAGVRLLEKTMSAVSERKPKELLDVVETLVSRGNDLRHFCRDLLGLIRDIFVYKAAGFDSSLLEGAALNEAEINALAEKFTEADLTRFFNSLAGTEAAIRTAANPRYTLEIGLANLAELGTVKSIEEILRTLDAISGGTSLPSPATQEKKTLNPEPQPEPKAEPPKQTEKPAEEQPREPEEPEYFADEPLEVLQYFEPEFEPQHDLAPVPEPAVAGLTAKLPPLSSDELEHYEIEAVDAAFSARMLALGDDLAPSANVNELRTFFADVRHARSAAAGIGTAADIEAGHAIVKGLADAFKDDDNVEIPKLSDCPTEAELIAYANALPKVRLLKRVFGAEVIEVKKK